MKSILICHPNEHYRKALKELLEIKLCESHVILDESYIDIAQLKNVPPPDYILISQNEKSDDELMRLIRLINQTILVKLIVLTFFDSDIYNNKLKMAGANAIYRIDMDIDQLIHLLQN